MESQRLGISNVPFRNPKKHAQEQDSAIEEEEEDSPIEEEEQDSLTEEEEKEPTQEEQLAAVVLEEEDGSDGEECELHVYEQRFDTRGEKVVLRAGTKSEFAPPKEKSHRACLVLTRHYGFGSSKQLRCTELEVQSRHIIKALREVIGTYPGIDFASKPVSIREPPRCLFHYHDELRQHAEASDNQQLKSHLRLCLQYMEKTLHKEIKIFQSLSEVSSPEIDHRHAWMVFKPGILVYEKYNGIERLYRLRSMEGEGGDNPYELRKWHLVTERIHQRRDGVGLALHKLQIDRYEGRKPVCELTFVPLDLHPEKERIRHDLLERGRKFLSLCGISHCFYDGVAYMCNRNSPNESIISCTHVCGNICGVPEGSLH
jgi:hypothetical protein